MKFAYYPMNWCDDSSRTQMQKNKLNAKPNRQNDQEYRHYVVSIVVFIVF